MINPPKYIKPTYRDYRDEDGSRVSKVQHVELLDLSKHIITIPKKKGITQNRQDFKAQNIAYNRAMAAKYSNHRNG